MTFKHFRLPDWLVVIGGAVVFLFGFFDWFDTGSMSSSAFKFTLTGVFPWLLIVGSALLTYQIRTGILTVQKWPWPTIFLFATVIGMILILVRVILGAKLGDFGDLPEGTPNPRFGRSFPLWLSFAGSIAVAVGAALSFVGSGGTFDDLPLVGRIKSAQAKSHAAKSSPKDAATSTSSSSSSSTTSGEPGRRLPPAEQDRPFTTDDRVAEGEVVDYGDIENPDGPDAPGLFDDPRR